MWLFSAPYRISIAGGGSDVPGWFNKELGAVFSFATHQRLYGLAHPSFDKQWLVRYRSEEKCAAACDINHDIIRQAVSTIHPDCPPLEISCHGELPGHNTGLGASSAFSAGFCSMLLRLTGWKDDLIPEVVAQRAKQVEVDGLGRDMGLQEIYACSYGGANLLLFEKDGVEVYPVNDDATERLTEWVSSHCAIIHVPEEEQLQNGFKDFSGNIASICAKEHMTRAGVCLAIETYNQVNNNNPGYLYDAVAASWAIKKETHPSALAGRAGAIVEELQQLGCAARLCGGGRGGFVFVCLRHRNDWERLRSFCTARSLGYRSTFVGLSPATTISLSTLTETGF